VSLKGAWDEMHDDSGVCLTPEDENGLAEVNTTQSTPSAAQLSNTGAEKIAPRSAIYAPPNKTSTEILRQRVATLWPNVLAVFDHSRNVEWRARQQYNEDQEQLGHSDVTYAQIKQRISTMISVQGPWQEPGHVRVTVKTLADGKRQIEEDIAYLKGIQAVDTRHGNVAQRLGMDRSDELVKKRKANEYIGTAIAQLGDAHGHRKKMKMACRQSKVDLATRKDTVDALSGYVARWYEEIQEARKGDEISAADCADGVDDYDDDDEDSDEEDSNEDSDDNDDDDDGVDTVGDQYPPVA
jgi:hypothetical protein